MAHRSSASVWQGSWNGMRLQIARKNVKNLTLRISPDGTLKASAPRWMSQERVLSFLDEKRPWIESHRLEALARQERERQLWTDGSVITLWGKPLTLRVVPADNVAAANGTRRAGSRVVARRQGDDLLVPVDPALDSDETRGHVRLLAEAWLANELRQALPDVIDACERQVGVTAARWRLRHMKTRWGSCNVKTRSITLNTELAERPKQCLAGVVTHELCHLLEPSHNAHFHALMDENYPDWRHWRAVLNDMPPRREG